MSKCPSCNKFCGLEMQDPEVNEITLNDAEVGFDMDAPTITAEVRIVRNSECCGDEIKEYTFNSETDVPASITDKMKEIRKKDPDAEFEVEEAGVSPYEEGGHRYKKSYYGFNLTVDVQTDSEAAKELYPDEAGPRVTVLGKVEIEDKIEASGMDELT